MIRKRDFFMLDSFIKDEKREEEQKGFLGEDTQEEKKRGTDEKNGLFPFDEKVQKEKGQYPPEEHKEVSPPDDPDDIVNVQGVESEDKRGDLGKIVFL
jgi:hypothetical protein